MATGDAAHWDERYTRLGPPSLDAVGPPTGLAPHVELLPVSGVALDVACGQGGGAVWLARRGLEVWGLDASPVAVDHARELADRAGVTARCRFDVVDLDGGLPAGPPVDLVVCHRFRDGRLDHAMVQRLAPGGVLAVVALSGTGRFRAARGELRAAFDGLDVLVDHEADGAATLIARRVVPA